MTPAESVVDASVAVRGLTGEDEDAVALLLDIAAGRATGHAPDLLVPEVTNALYRYIGVRRTNLADAQAFVEVVASSSIQLHPSGDLASLALEVAVARDLSAYDAFYAVLAEARDLPLVTADRRLAAAVAGSVLLG